MSSEALEHAVRAGIYAKRRAGEEAIVSGALSALYALLAEVARLEQKRDEARRTSLARLSNIEGARAILWQEGDHDGAPLVVLAESRMAALAVSRKREQSLLHATKAAMRELGVPGVGYPAPVANAVEILRAALVDEPAAVDGGAPEETWFNKTSAAADEPYETGEGMTDVEFYGR